MPPSKIDHYQELIEDYEESIISLEALLCKTTNKNDANTIKKLIKNYIVQLSILKESIDRTSLGSTIII